MTRRQKYIALALLLLLQVIDYFSTRAALAHGAWELNPLVHDLGLGQAKFVVAGLVLLLIWRATKPRRVWALCIIYTLIVSSNVLVALTHAH